MSKEERLARLLKSKQEFTWEDWDKSFSRQITAFEREMGFPVMGDYPAMKFFQQQEDLNYLITEENRRMKNGR